MIPENDVFNIKEPPSSTPIQDILLEAPEKPSAVQSVFRAANILTCLSHGINSITEIAHYCKLNKATVHRLLKALGESRLAIQDPVSRRYFLGHSITHIASNPQTTHAYLTMCAARDMMQLSDLTYETIFLSILVGLQYIVVHEITSRHGLRVVEVSNRSGYVPAGAASKALLSKLNNKELKIAIINMDFGPDPQKAAREKERLMAELKRIRQQGYIISSSERIKGAMCVSAPINNYVLPVSLSIVGPESRIKPNLADYTEKLKLAAANISEKISQAFQIK